MSALMEVDQQGRVVAYELRETVIRSNERMTYTDVNKLLTHADPQPGDAVRRCSRVIQDDGRVGAHPDQDARATRSD